MKNRLALEKSPYLLQHAKNPIDWYPWGEEALSLAKEKDLPIFLSIGYSTCHYCHLMERESFRDVAIADVLNRSFISIKVDKEELPAIDRLYMDFGAALMGTTGGWPLNIFLTPDCKPFFAICYTPPRTGSSMMGFYETVLHIENILTSEKKQVMYEQADKLFVMLQAREEFSASEEITLELFELFMRGVFDFCEPLFGGFKRLPKFPLSYHITLFLHYSLLKEDQRAAFFSEVTLNHMARGGLFDHLLGGFFRYALDAKWAIPHFEKTLYDNALLSRTYLESSLYFKEPFYQRIAISTLEFMKNELKSSEGGFFSAIDSDSEEEEGKAYCWTKEELSSLSSPETLPIILEYFGLLQMWNYGTKFVLQMPKNIEDFPGYEEVLQKAVEVLIEKRKNRSKPAVDDKIITSWNALAIISFAKAGFLLKNDLYTTLAKEAFHFIKSHLFMNNLLYHSYCKGEVKHSGILEDYTFLIASAITLFECGQGLDYLTFALHLTELVEEHFKSPSGFYYEAKVNESPLFPKVGLKDGAEPSGNGVHAENLARLYQITKKEIYHLRAKEILTKTSFQLIEESDTSCYLGLALFRLLDEDAITLYIVFDEKESLKEELIDLIRQNFLPHLSLVWLKEGEKVDFFNMPRVEGQTTIYIYVQDTCVKKVTSIDELASELLI